MWYLEKKFIKVSFFMLHLNIRIIYVLKGIVNNSVLIFKFLVCSIPILKLAIKCCIIDGEINV